MITVTCHFYGRIRRHRLLAFCDCPKEITGKVAVSLEVIADWGLTVRGLDGVARV